MSSNPRLSTSCSPSNRVPLPPKQTQTTRRNPPSRRRQRSITSLYGRRRRRRRLRLLLAIVAIIIMMIMARIPRLVRGNCHFHAASVPFSAFVGITHRPAVQQGRHRHHNGQTITSGQRCASFGRNSRHNHHNFQLDDESSQITKIEKEIQASLCQYIVPLVVENTDTAQQHQQSPQVVFVVGVSGGCDSVGLLHGLVRVLTPKEQDSSSSSSRANWGFVLSCDSDDGHDHPFATTTRTSGSI